MPVRSRLYAHKTLWIFVAAATCLRLAVIGHFGLGVDEAHYVLYGLFPALSYFDHPPLVGWTELLFTRLFGVDAFAARLPAVIIGAAASVMIYFWLLRLFNDKRAAFWGIVALNASFLFNALFMMLMPDTLLYLFVVPIMTTALAIERQETLRRWLLLGLLLGLAGLAKYTAVLFVAALMLYFALKRRWDLFTSAKMLPAVALAALIVSPVLIWNARHDWISFAFQSAHVAGSGGIDWTAFYQSLLAQFGAYSPLLFPLAFYGLWRALKARDNDALLLGGIFGAVIIVFFTYNSLHARALPHWTSPFYLLFIPAGTAIALRQGRKWRRYVFSAVGITGALTLVLYAELRFTFLPFPDYRSVHRDLYGWNTIMRRAAAHIEHPGKEAAAVTNWSLASRAIYYARPYGIDVYLIDDRYDQFDLWQHGSPVGKDLLFVTTHDFHEDIADSMRCRRVEPAERFDLTLNGRKVNTVTLTWCRGFEGAR